VIERLGAIIDEKVMPNKSLQWTANPAAPLACGLVGP